MDLTKKKYKIGQIVERIDGRQIQNDDLKKAAHRCIIVAFPTCTERQSISCPTDCRTSLGLSALDDSFSTRECGIKEVIQGGRKKVAIRRYKIIRSAPEILADTIKDCNLLTDKPPEKPWEDYYDYCNFCGY